MRRSRHAVSGASFSRSFFRRCNGILARTRKTHFREAGHQEMRAMSERETLRSRLLILLEEEMGESFELPADDQDLRETLGLDSVDLVGLVMRIEREFHVRLAPEELAKVKLVGDLLDLMEAKLADWPHQVSSGPTGVSEGAG
jgi:acyl carrier protein